MDSSDPAPAPAPVRARRRSAPRIALVSAGVFVVALVALGLAAVWFAQRESTVRWLAAEVARRSGGDLVLENVSGTLAHGISIGRARFTRDGLRVEIEHAVFRWVWVPIDRVVVHDARIASVRVVPGPSKDDAPATLPATLRLPIQLDVERLRLDRLVIAPVDGAPTEILGIDLRYDGGPHGHAIALARAQVQGAILSGRARVAGDAPFDTVLDLAATTPAMPQVAAAALHVDGPLARLAVGAAVELARGSGRATARTVVTPFADAPLDALVVDAHAVRLAPWIGTDAVDATVSGQARLRQVDGQWRGPVELVNTAPGRVDVARLPLERVRANVSAGERVVLERLVAQLSGGGTLEGRAELDPAPMRFALRARGVRLDALHAALTPVAVSGPVDLQVQASGDVQARIALEGAGVGLDAQAVLAGQRLSVQPMRLRAGAGHIDATLALDLSGRQALALDARATAFEPGRLVALAGTPRAKTQDGASRATLPDARIDARLRVTGELAEPRRLDLDLAIDTARVAGLALAGTARARVASTRTGFVVSDADVALRSDENRLTAQGGYGRPEDRVAIAVRAPRLDRFSAVAGVPLAGRLVMDATVGATVGATQAHPDLVSRFTVDGLLVGRDGALARAERIEGHADLTAARLDAQIRASTAASAGFRVREATLTAQGSREDHTVALRAHSDDAAFPLDADIALAGGLRAGAGDAFAWRGRLVRFENAGALALRLLAPAPVELSATQQRVEAAAFALGDARFTIANFTRDGARLRTRGEFDRLPLRALGRWVEPLASPRNTLVLGGRWDVDVGAAINGSVRIARQTGDVALSRFSAGELGVEQLDLAVDARDGAIEARLDANARRAGTLAGRLSTRVTRREGAFGIAGGTPFDYRLQGQLTSLAWVGLVVDTPLTVDGRVTVDVQRSGHGAQGTLSGALVGENLALRTFEPRAQLTDGQVRLTVFDNRVSLDQFAFRGRGGTLTGTGVATFTGRAPDGEFAFKLDRLDAITDPLARVLASGGIRVALARGRARVDGTVRVDEARIQLADIGAPTLGGDVTIVRGEQARAADDAQRRAKEGFPVDLDLRIDLGDRFAITGFGADAELGGSVQLVAAGGQPLRALGTVQTKKGTYTAYGQELEIKRGVVNFGGALDNPGLNIAAERPNLPVTVGVEVTGTARQPKVALYSKPEMSSTEKLSWLALGRGLENASGSDLQMLSLAASALFSQGGGGGPSVTQRIAQTFGVDEISVRGGNNTTAAGQSGASAVESAIVAVGKRLSERLYLTFERSLSGASTIAKLRYEVGDRWNLQTSTGTENAVDVFFTFKFD